MRFCIIVGLPDIVTSAKVYGNRFGHFCVVGVEFQVFPLTLVVVSSLQHSGTTVPECDCIDVRLSHLIKYDRARIIASRNIMI